MATTQNCIYKSVTLAAGEQFTLPPGAEIISATDINSFTSTCPKPTTLDTFVCGSLQWGIQPISGGGGTAPFSVGGINPPDTHCIGVKIGDVKYLFPSPISGDDITLIPNTINSLTSLSGIFDVYSTDVYDSTNNRIRYTMNFKTLSSLFNEGIYLMFTASDFTNPEVLAISITCPPTP